MALINAFLVRWADGFHEVEDAASIAEHGRKEGFISLADVQSTKEAEAVCAALFASMAGPQIATTMAIDPTGVDDVPYTHFRKGDSISAPAYEGGVTSQRVRALTTTETENGRVLFVPELRAVVQEEAERIQRWLKRMANGAVGGTTSAPSPTTGGGVTDGFSPIPQVELPPFSYAGPIGLDLSGVYRPIKATKLTRLAASLRVAGSTTTTIALLINGSSEETISLVASDTYEYIPIDIDVTVGTAIQVQTTAAGTGAEDLVVQILTSG